jgi:Fur family ferric uptake transcriptional regulator
VFVLQATIVLPAVDKVASISYNKMIMRLNRKDINTVQGHRLTAQRRLLLELLRKAKGHIDAKELYHRASARDESISPATVYRSLNLFKQLGLVDERRLGKVRCYYEIKQSPEHQHLVCQGCGKVIEFESPLIRKLVEIVRAEHGFNVTKAELYLEGYCSECEQKKAWHQITF